MAATLFSFTFPRSRETVRCELERKRVKNLNLRLRRDGSLHLSVPPGTSAAAIEAFLAREEDWYLAARARTTAREAAHPDVQTLAAGDTLPYLGGQVKVVYERVPGRTGSLSFDEPARLLTVRVPDPADEGWRLPAILRFEKQQTAALVGPLVAAYTPVVTKKGARAPQSLHYKHMVSRYGSCTAATGSLCFNARLCEYPLPFIEYVVVHELCHLLEQNHSAAFWREVAALLPDYRERARLVKDPLPPDEAPPCE